MMKRLVIATLFGRQDFVVVALKATPSSSSGHRSTGTLRQPDHAEFVKTVFGAETALRRPVDDLLGERLQEVRKEFERKLAAGEEEPKEIGFLDGEAIAQFEMDASFLLRHVFELFFEKEENLCHDTRFAPECPNLCPQGDADPTSAQENEGRKAERIKKLNKLLSDMQAKKKINLPAGVEPASELERDWQKVSQAFADVVSPTGHYSFRFNFFGFSAIQAYFSRTAPEGRAFETTRGTERYFAPTRGTERYFTVGFAAEGPGILPFQRFYNQFECVFKFDSEALARGMTVEKLQIVSDPLWNTPARGPGPFGSIEYPLDA
ncbi:unnamed protein product [Amoebophrya sp. A120]|nr:unnamed protein product [Amoebophrya sp. A120]|eukprot:GSA120T00013161001.1